MARSLLTALCAVVCLYLCGCSEDPARGTIDALESLAVSQPSPPSIRIVVPVPTANPAQVPPVFTVEWVAENTKKVRWVLLGLEPFGGSVEAALDYIRTHPDAPEWSKWQNYKPRRNEGTSWQPPEQEFGAYVLAVQGRRSNNEVTDIIRGENAVYLLVSRRTTGPILTVFNRYIGSMVTSTTETPPTVLDIPSGVPMSYTLRANAEPYGGIVTGYRYGWDIIDPDDDTQWAIDYTPFVGETAEVPPRTFSFGSHTVHIEVIDNYDFKSRITVRTDVIPTTVERPLLIVDDWFEGPSSGFANTNGAVPSDVEHDAFWLDMTSDVAGFDPAVDVVDLGNGEIPPLSLLLQYQNIIWNANGSHTLTSQAVLGKIIQWINPLRPVLPGPVTPDIVALYMAAGGHVMLCGGELMTLAVPRPVFGGVTFPIIFRYEIGGDQDGVYQDSEVGTRGIGDNSFAYLEGCLNVLDIAYISNPGQVRRPGQVCPVNAIRDHNGQADGLRACAPVGAGGTFPRLELRPEVAGDPTRFYHESRLGLNCDIYNPQYFEALTPCGPFLEYGRTCFQPIYTHEGMNTLSVIYGSPVAYWTSVFADRMPDGGGVAARSVIMGFHPVYFEPAQVREALHVILFDEWRLARL